MTDKSTVSLRERVKQPPAQALVNAYYAPAISNGVKYVFPHEMRVHLAHALMLADRNIVDRDDIAAILAELLRLNDEGPATLQVDYLQEDLYSYVESHLIRRLGPDVGGRLHTGRSRNDLNVTSWRLALRGKVLDVLEGLAALRGTVLRLARDHRELVMPGYTHSQHAQPISLGYYLLAFADVLARDFRRLAGALDHVDRSPLGAGALNTTAFPIDRHATAASLGFPGLVEVAYDAVSSRDDAHEVAAALAILMTGLSRLATDLQNWNTAEYGFIELADEFSSVSRIMPQKKNPQGLEYAKAAAAHVTGALATVLACSKNTSYSDVNDGVTALNVPVLDAVERTRHCLTVIEGILATLNVRPEAMRTAAAVGFGTATELTDAIVRASGLSFRKAHNIVGRVVRETIEAGRIATDISPEDIARAARGLFNLELQLAPEVVANALDPDKNVRTRTLTGGPAPETVFAMVERRVAAMNEDSGSVSAIRRRIAEADAALMERSRSFTRICDRPAGR
jgi:argininosuccinate lyase